MLELTPTQKVDVDGSREVPTVLISDQGTLQLAPPRCLGENCGSYSIDMPPMRGYEHYLVPQTTYDPYAENYAQLGPNYPPSRVMAPHPASFQEVPYPVPSSRVGSIPPTPIPAGLNGPIAGWNAPLIQTGNFQPAMNGGLATATVTGTTPTATTSAPPPIPGAAPLNPYAPNPSAIVAGQVPPPPAPLPVAFAPAPAPAPTPASTTNNPPVESKDANEGQGGEPPKPDAPAPAPPPPPPATPSPAEVQKIADDVKAVEQAKDKEKNDGKDAPKQKRSFRSGSSSTVKRAAPKVLRKRQLQEVQLSPMNPVGCPPPMVETKETIIPVTEAELAQLQDETAELISYPTIGENGQEQTVYDVVQIKQDPEPFHPTLKQILESGAAKMAAGDEANSEGYGSQYRRSAVEELNSEKRDMGVEESVLPLASTFPKLDKRLKYGAY